MSLQERTFTQAIEAKFVTIPGEKLVFVRRKHWTTFGFPIALLALLGAVSIVSLGAVMNLLANYFTLSFLATSFVLVFLASLSLRSVIDWYFNIYVVTNRRIIEISYSPLTSHKINQVLLDQVRCTEIDTKIEGIVNDLLNIGHVIVTFDRPTHQEELVLEYVKDPRKIANYLQQTLYKQAPAGSYYVPQQNSSRGIYNRNAKSGRWTYTENLDNKYLEQGVVWNI